MMSKHERQERIRALRPYVHSLTAVATAAKRAGDEEGCRRALMVQTAAIREMVSLAR